MSKIKLVSLLLACFAIIAASPLAMGVTIYGGTATQTSGAGVADGVNGATRTLDATAAGGPAVLDAYLYAHAGVPAGVGSAKAHYAGSVSGATFSPTSKDGQNAPLGTFSASASGDVNTGVTTTAAGGQVNAYAIIGAKVLKATAAGTGARDDSPVQGTAYVFSKIDGSPVATSIVPLGGTTLPELGAASVFTATPISGTTTGEAYARANGAAAFTGTGINTANTKQSQIYGNVNANTYVDATLDQAATDSMAASVATAVAKPAAAGPGVASYATAGVVTRLDLTQPGLDGRSNATATVTPGSGADYAAKAGAWDYTFLGSAQPNINENVFAASDASLYSDANTRKAGDAAGTGARVNTIASHDLNALPARGAEQYAATFIQTYGAGVRVVPGSFETQKMSYGSVLEDAASSAIVRDGAKITSESADVGALSPSLDQGFLAGGHQLSAGGATPQYASSLFTQEAFGKMSSAASAPYGSSDVVVINRQPATIGGIMPASVEDPYLFWAGAGLTTAILPGTVTQGIYNNGPAWNGVAANDVGAAYGLTSSATANYYADNVKTDSVLSDINWIEGSSLMYSIQNLQRSFTYTPADGFHNDFVVQVAAVPSTVPYQQFVVSTNSVP